MASGTYLPDSNIHYTDNDGNPLAGGTLEFFEAGTSTPLDTFNDPDLDPLHVNANPYTLNSSGWANDPIFLSVASYKLRVKDANGVTLWTRDNIRSVALTSEALDVAVWQFGGDASSPIPAAQVAYPSGVTFDKCHAGTTWWEIDSSNLSGDYVLTAMMMVLVAGTVTAALVDLTDGSPDTPLVTVTSSSLTGERQESATITFAAGGSAKKYAIKVKTNGVIGMVWGLQIIKKA